MKQEKVFDFAVWFFVAFVHIVALWAMSQGKPPQISSGVAVLQVVDLSGFKEAAPAPVVAPKPVIQEPKKEILAVKKKDKKPDIVVKKKTLPKVEKQPEPPKPIPQEEVAVKEVLPVVAENTAENGTGSGTGKGASDNKGTGGDNTHGEGGGNGGGATTAASHIGGHLHNPKPPYPQRSIENGEEGSVRLRVTVEANGKPSAVSLVKSSGYSALDRSALKTVREQYRFIPATRAGVAVRSDYTFSIKFELP